MADESNDTTGKDDFQHLSSEFMKILARNQEAFSQLMSAPKDAVTNMLDPFNVLDSFAKGARQLASTLERWRTSASMTIASR